MKIDYIRVYQPKDARNVGCNPPDFPTADYINQWVFHDRFTDTWNQSMLFCARNIRAYTDANLTTWRGDYGQPFPKNSRIDQCSNWTEVLATVFVLPDFISQAHSFCTTRYIAIRIQHWHIPMVNSRLRLTYHHLILRLYQSSSALSSSLLAT